MGRGEAFGEDARQSEPRQLDSEVPMFDLSPYEEAVTGAGVLAGPARSDFEQVGVGQGGQAADAVADLTGPVTTAGHGSYELPDGQLGELMDNLLDLGDRVERAQVFALSEAMSRGLVDRSDAGSPTQWLSDKAPSLEPAQICRIVQAAHLLNDPAHAALRGVLADGRVTVRGLLVAVREAKKVRPKIPRCSWTQALQYFLTIADHGTSVELKKLARRIVATYGQDQAPAEEDEARRHESLSWWELPGGMTRVRADLSPGDAATFAEAVQALATPRPGTTADGDTVPADATTWDGKPSRTHSADLRSPGKRRADALMELVGAAQRATTDDGGRASVKATITLPLSVLIGDLVDAGYATTALGRVIDAGTARTMACGAQLTPMVLGTDSQPLDVGRASRPFRPATRAAIAHRDRSCTFPGCDRPAPWCEAHHAVPWWVGGRSTLSNGVLLCSRHHHIVHAKGYLPYVTETGVIWDLVPGRMPTEPLPPDDPLTYGPGPAPPLRDSA